MRAKRIIVAVSAQEHQKYKTWCAQNGITISEAVRQHIKAASAETIINSKVVVDEEQ